MVKLFPLINRIDSRVAMKHDFKAESKHSDFFHRGLFCNSVCNCARPVSKLIGMKLFFFSDSRASIM